VRRVLLLNVTYEPLTTVGLRRAVCLVLGEKAEVVHDDAGGTLLRSASLVLAMPSVIRLRRYVRVPHRSRIPLTRGALNFGAYLMGNGLSRLATRFLGAAGSLEGAKERQDQPLDAEAAERCGLITAAHDDIDWDDEIRIMLEERASFSPDALSGLEANLRFPGPETMETRIFGRLSAWQNWIFQRPNAVGEAGALTLYGTGRRPGFDMGRV